MEEIPVAVLPPITDYCYSGRAALQRAMSLRSRVRTARAAGGAAEDGLDDLLEEIFDLVQLGIQST